MPGDRVTGKETGVQLKALRVRTSQDTTCTHLKQCSGNPSASAEELGILFGRPRGRECQIQNWNLCVTTEAG